MYKEYKGTSLTAYILWLNSKICIEIGEFENALELLNTLIEYDPENIMCDDALFKIAEIYEIHLKDKEKAKI